MDWFCPEYQDQRELEESDKRMAKLSHVPGESLESPCEPEVSEGSDTEEEWGVVHLAGVGREAGKHSESTEPWADEDRFAKFVAQQRNHWGEQTSEELEWLEALPPFLFQETIDQKCRRNQRQVAEHGSFNLQSSIFNL